jgi:hypothetical protein
MKKFLTALVLACSLLCTSLVQADKSQYKLHLIISWDMSESMRSEGPVNWTEAGADFFSEYFANYHHRCQVLTVDMISWGLQSLPPVHIELKSQEESALLADYASKLTRFRHVGTSPSVGMYFANSYVVPGYDRTVILFISDASIAGAGNSNLWAIVAPTTDFFAVSLTDTMSRDYFNRHIVPRNGHHFHAETEADFKETLTMILDQLGYDHCPAS